MSQASFYRGLTFMLLSAAGMSLVGLFGKLGIADLTVSALMFWRFLASSLLLFCSLWIFGDLKGICQFQHIKIQLVRAFFVLLAQYCFFYYLTQNNLLNATALLNTGPVFISVIEWGILRQKVGISSWIGSIVSFLGALFILQPDKEIFSSLSLIGLLAGVSQGASQVVFGLQSEREEKPYITVLHLFLLCALFSLIPFLYFEREIGKSFHSLDIWVILLLAGASILSQTFRAEAYKYGTPSRLSPYLYLAVLLAGVWDWAIFGEEPNGYAITGAILIILGALLKIYLRNWILKKKN